MTIDLDSMQGWGLIVATLFTSLLSWLQSLKNTSKIQEIHLTMNGRLTELLKVAISEAHLKGVAQGAAKVAQSSEVEKIIKEVSQVVAHATQEGKNE